MKISTTETNKALNQVKGKKVRVIANGAGHGRKNGTELKVPTNVSATHNGVGVLLMISGYNYYASDLEVIGCTKAEIQGEIVELKSQIADMEARIAYIDHTGSEEFDETEFKVWNVLQTLKTKKTDIEKAKIIAQLVNT